MPIVVTEKIESRRLLASRDGKASTFDLLLTVTGTDSELFAKNAASAFAPEVWGSGFPQLWKQTVYVAPIGFELWEATVHYDTTAPEPLSANDSFEFAIGGGSVHITQSLATQAFPSSLPNNQGAIGVTEQGVQGADVFAPEMVFSETHWFVELSPVYKRTLFALRGSVNASAFRGWSAGEVLFEGVDARRQDNRFQTPWSVTYRFRVSPNELLVVAGNEIAKEGWDLLDIRYQGQAGTDALVRVPVGAYLHRVYPRSDFALLGIGV